MKITSKQRTGDADSMHDRAGGRTRKTAFRIVSIFFILFVIIAAAAVIGSSKALDEMSVSFAEDAYFENKRFEKLNRKKTLYTSGIDMLNHLSMNNRLNVLLYGLDKDETRTDAVYRSDTILVASIDLDTRCIALISIPRDTLTKIGTAYGEDKINSCFYYAYMRAPKNSSAGEIRAQGAELLKETVSSLLGIPIHYSAGLDMNGIVDIVDSIGGVDVTVHTDVYIHNSVVVEKGYQTLSGLSFLRYARYRRYAEGDIDRINVQQILMKALFEKVKTISLTSYPRIVGQLMALIDTDISTDDMISLAYLMKDFSSADITAGTIPGSAIYIDEISYWKVSSREVSRFLADMMEESNDQPAGDKKEYQDAS